MMDLLNWLYLKEKNFWRALVLNNCLIGVTASHRDSRDKMKEQKLGIEQKSKSTQTPSYWPSDIGDIVKKSVHWKYNCPPLKKKRKKN